MVDLNADVGESFGRWRLGDDAALLDTITSANVACGFHAGDPTTLRSVCRMAADRRVRIGAQVGYRDLAGFGRRYVDVSGPDLAADVLYQLGALDGLARAAGSAVTYCKPHGALYHAVLDDRVQAEAVLEAVVAFDRPLAVLGFPDSLFLRLAAEAGLAVVREGFVDRRYGDDGRLLPRGRSGAVLHDADEVVAQALSLAVDGEVVCADGTTRTQQVDSLCLHGDTDGAVALASSVREALRAAEVQIRVFGA